MLKSKCWERLTFSKLWFSKSKICVSRLVFGELQLWQISLNFIHSERNYDVLKSSSPCILLNKYINFSLLILFRFANVYPTHCFREKNLALQLIWELQLKGKLWWLGACKRKTKAFIVPFIFSERIFFNIWAVSQCIVYWIHF